MDDASTASTDAGIEERLRDFADSDNEQEDASEEQPTICVSSQDASIVSSKKRWADLEDSEDDTVTLVSQRHEPTKLAWADLADSEEEEMEENGTLPAFSTQATAEIGAAISTSLSESELGARSFQQRGEERPKSTRRRQGRKATTAVEIEPATSCGPDHPSQHKAGSWSRHNLASSASNKSSRWSQPWAASSPAWWHSEATSREWYPQKGGSKSAAKLYRAERRGAAYSAKPQCQFYIGIEEEPHFKVTRRVLGSHGKFVKAIAESSGAKLRLRGRGSGFLEGAEQLESTDELMLCVSAPDAAGYADAVRLVRELLEGVYEEYRVFCAKSGWAAPQLEVRMHEGPRAGSR